MDKLHLVAQVLMEKETIDADEFYRLMEGKTEDAQPELNADDDNNRNGRRGALAARRPPCWKRLKTSAMLWALMIIWAGHLPDWLKMK